MSPDDTDSDRGCPKCGHDEAHVGNIAVSSSGIQAMADFEDRGFRIIYCDDCGYTEHYASRADEEALADLFFE